MAEREKTWLQPVSLFWIYYTHVQSLQFYRWNSKNPWPKQSKFIYVCRRKFLSHICNLKNPSDEVNDKRTLGMMQEFSLCIFNVSCSLSIETEVCFRIFLGRNITSAPCGDDKKLSYFFSFLPPATMKMGLKHVWNVTMHAIELLSFLDQKLEF